MNGIAKLWLLACLLVGCFSYSNAFAQISLKPGVFLVATEKIDKGLFKESVILVLRHDEQASIGLVVNKPSKMLLAKVLPKHGLAESDAQVYFAGPVNPMMISALSMTARPHPTMTPVIEGVYWVPGIRALGHIVQQLMGEERVRGYMGLSSWDKGQLQREIASGSWLITSADKDSIFDGNPEKLWKELYARWSGRWI